MRITIQLAIAFCLLAAPAGAAFAAISDCLSIEESLDRLACYDREAGFQPEISSVKGAGDWVVRQETSKIDDSANVFLFLESFEQTNCPYKTGPHTLVLACRENVTSAYILFADCFMSDIQGKGRVTYRLDSEPAATVSMHESNDHMALGLWRGNQAVPFIKKMLRHERLLIRATPFSDSAVTGEYRIAGLDEAIQPLREACNW